MPSTQEQSTPDYRSQAREHHLFLHDQIRDLPDLDQRPLKAKVEAAAHTFTANAVVSILIGVYAKVVVTADFDSGEKLKFEGTLYGPIFGAGGISFGGGVSDEAAAQLAGHERDCGIILSPTGVSITWRRGLIPVATFLGGGPNVGLGWALGKGTWKKVS